MSERETSKHRNVETSKDNNDRRERDLGPELELPPLDQLRAIDCAPDLTRRIMGRLGYMQVSNKVARRIRLRRWAGRAGIMMAAAIAISVGFKAFESSPEIRRPAGVTIPAAIGNDLQQHQQRIGNMIQTIRNLAPPMRADEPAQPRHESNELPAVQDDISLAPFQWV